MRPGYFPANYFPTNYWPENYWPDYGAVSSTYTGGWYEFLEKDIVEIDDEEDIIAFIIAIS